MNVTSFYPAILVFAIVLITLWLLDRLMPQRLGTQRIETIDGIRGYLAIGVFLHHSCIWYFFLKNGTWIAPPSKVYTQLGQVSVSLFFMITAFLFTSKIISSDHKNENWIRLYISRFMRIVPLWLVVTLLATIIVCIIRYLGLDSGDESLYSNSTSVGFITAGVTWTLYFEWTFYFILPWLALAVNKKPPAAWLLLSLIFITLNGWYRVFSFHTFTFLIGIASAWLVQIDTLKLFAKSRKGSTLSLALLVFIIIEFSGSYSFAPTILLGVVFLLIAAGADLFGILRLRISSLLGEITYSIYLIHGFFLYFVFRFIVGFEEASLLSSEQHWLVVVAIAPLLVIMSFFSFNYLEKPAINATTMLTNKIKGLLGRCAP